MRESVAQADRSQLQAILSDRFVLSWRQAALVGWIALLCLLLSWTPLSTHTTWLHIAHGEAVLATGSLPKVDVTQPLAVSMPYRQLSWLSDVFWAQVGSSKEAVSYATTLLGTVVLLIAGFALWFRTKNSLVSIMGIGLLAACVWSQISLASSLLVVYPLYLILVLQEISLLETSENGRLESESWTSTFLKVLIIALWANLDSSAWVGVVLLTTSWLGRCLSYLAANQAAWSKLIQQSGFWTGATRTQLAVLATLLTPLGIGLWTEWNLQIREFGLPGQSLSLGPIPALAWVLSWILLIVGLYRGHRLNIESMLLLGTFGLLSFTAAELIFWYAPLAVFLIFPLVQRSFAIGEDPPATQTQIPEQSQAPILKFAYSSVAVLLVWIAFAVSPLSQPVLGGSGRTITQLFGDRAPLAAVDYVKRFPVEGLVFAPAPWADLLQSRLGGQSAVYATTEMHRLPQQARYDYNRLIAGDSAWESIAERYAIDCVIIDQVRQPAFAESAPRSEHWQQVYADDVCVILRRRGA